MNAKFAKERAELEEKERAAKAVADVARKQIDAAKRQVTEAIENRELTGAIARAKFAIESALDAYSRAGRHGDRGRQARQGGGVKTHR